MIPGFHLLLHVLQMKYSYFGITKTFILVSKIVFILSTIVSIHICCMKNTYNIHSLRWLIEMKIYYCIRPISKHTEHAYSY